jgi:hypothetical protein
LAGTDSGTSDDSKAFFGDQVLAEVDRPDVVATAAKIELKSRNGRWAGPRRKAVTYWEFSGRE